MAFKPKFLRPEDDSFTAERDPSTNEEAVSNFVFNKNQSLGIQQQREQLPIRRVKNNIMYGIENYQTLILVGETGCGKSTQVPQFLFEYGWESKGIIGVTEPRRVAALSLAERVATEMGQVVGETVGVAVRFHYKSGNDTAIRYMTEGVLYREMLSDPLLKEYGVIMIDEAHERNMMTDILLSLLKKIAFKREDLKLIIASATMDCQFFKDYFNFKGFREGQTTDTSAIVGVEGRTYPIECYNLEEPTNNYIKSTVETILKIHREEDPGGILAFLTGQEEIKEAIELLEEHMNQGNSSKDTEMYIVPMYGTLNNHDLVKVFFTPPRGSRKVVLATNIAETSVTIPGIGYVVDCGLVKMKFFVKSVQTELLKVVPISKATAQQRAGRAGRTQPGKVFRLYKEETYEMLSEFTVPEIVRSDLTSLILQLKAVNVEDICNFDYPSPPPQDHFLAAVEILVALEALNDDAELTDPLGFFMAPLPLPAMLGRMLWKSAEMGCSEQILSILAMLQVKSVFSKGSTGQDSIDSKRHKAKFEVEEGDLITMLNVYANFIDSGATKEFCGRHWLVYKHLKRAQEIKEQLQEYVRQHHNLPILSTTNTEVIVRCIATGLFPNAAYLHHSGEYRKVKGEIEMFIHPTSCLYNAPRAKYVLYNELQHSTKLYMKDITVVQVEWLTELVPHYYRVDNYLGPEIKKQKLF